MERECAAGLTPHFDLAARDCAIAQDANPLIVERMPFAPQIGRLEEREFFFWKQWGVHWKSVQIKAAPSLFGNQHRR